MPSFGLRVDFGLTLDVFLGMISGICGIPGIGLVPIAFAAFTAPIRVGRSDGFTLTGFTIGDPGLRDRTVLLRGRFGFIIPYR